MNQETHIQIAAAVARAVGFPRPDDVGAAAATPDQIRIASIDGVGTEILKRNISSLTHFRGYNLHMDRSLGRLDLPNRDVSYIPGQWPQLPSQCENDEPLFRLLQVPGYSHAADEMTWPSGRSYARFFQDVCYVVTRKGYRPIVGHDLDLAVNAGRSLHYVGDYCVPQHRRNELLAHHIDTENQIHRRYVALRSSGELQTIIDQEVRDAARWDAFDVCTALLARDTPRVSFWACRRRKVVDDAIRDAIRCSASVLKQILRYRSEITT